ncbi:glycerol-3-phosphate dehydrogenase [NAD(+)] 1 [Trichomonascus vanleenenianus]|uniref:glycerol-3-phosphate dehydrogenase (NAD(+)) GPD1 n=1 Tax=Trichomonascus vanleenenianus TaxID=2268995 RepID=UPI003ECA6CD3
MSQASQVTSRINNFGLNNTQAEDQKRFKVCVVGSGNWGTTIAKIVAENTAAHPDVFEKEVNMWVFQEQIEGRNLTDIINTDHENVKYLPEIKLPHNLVANPDIVDTVTDCDLVVFNIPHQFLRNICKMLSGIDFAGVRAISCLKGLEVSKDGVFLLSDYIKDQLGMHCGVLSGANLAPEVAREKFCETTIAYDRPDDFFEGDIDANILKTLFQRTYFHVRVSSDAAAVSIGGALKNVVAIAAGFVEGHGWGDNAKAAIMRRGLLEMIKFGVTFFPGCKPETFTEESAGVADLITSCAGGRNCRIGREFAKNTSEPIEEVEKRLLNGQSAQGLATAMEVHELLTARNMIDDFPLFTATYKIAFEGMSIDDLPAFLED